MTNGFYNSNELNRKNKRRLLKEAINLSYTTRCESKYANFGIKRENYRVVDRRLSLLNSIELLLKDKKSTLDFIDRYANNKGYIEKEFCEYEITIHSTNGPNDGWLLVYIMVNEENFNYLKDKYQLKLIEW